MYQMLVVDDEPLIRYGIRDSIEWSQAGIDQVFTAESGEEALAILEEQNIQILITDIRMEDMTGVELIEQIRISKKVPYIVVMTAYEEFEYAQKCLRLHVEEFLIKPMDENQLFSIVKGFVEREREKEFKQWQSQIQRRVIGSSEQKKLNELICQLVSGINHSEKLIKEICEKYGYKTDQLLQIALFYPKIVAYKGEEIYLEYDVLDFCRNNVDLCGLGITFLDEQKRIGVIFFCEDSDRGSKKSGINGFLSLLNSEFSISQKVMTGSIVKGFSQLSITYKEAEHLLHDMSYHEEKNVAAETLIQKKDMHFLKKIEEIKLEILANADDVDAVFHAYEKYIRMMGEYEISIEYLRYCCFELASAVWYGQVENHREGERGKIAEFTEALVFSDRKGALEITRAFLNRMYESQVKESHMIVEKAKKYMQEHLGEKLSVSAIAQMYYVVPSYFSRLFKRVEGIGCNEYIMQKRMEQAQYLLRETNMKIGDIAADTGYTDKNYFSITFKNRTGLTPMAYREKYR